MRLLSTTIKANEVASTRRMENEVAKYKNKAN